MLIEYFIWLKTIFETVNQRSVAHAFDLVSHYFNDSLSVDAVLNPSDFIGEISFRKEKIGSGKSELRVFSLTDQDLRWKTGFASRVRTLMGTQKGVINYGEMEIIRPLTIFNGYYSFTVSKASQNPSVRSESYKLTQINDSREESYKIRKFYSRYLSLCIFCPLSFLKSGLSYLPLPLFAKRVVKTMLSMW